MGAMDRFLSGVWKKRHSHLTTKGTDLTYILPHFNHKIPGSIPKLSFESDKLHDTAIRQNTPIKIVDFPFAHEIAEESEESHPLDYEAEALLLRSPDHKFQSFQELGEESYVRWPETSEMPLREALEKMREGQNGVHLGVAAKFHDEDILDFELPENLWHLSPSFTECMLWSSIGEKETSSHFDMKHILWIPLKGTKTVYLLPPSHTALMKPTHVPSMRYNSVTKEDMPYHEMAPLYHFSPVSLPELRRQGHPVLSCSLKPTEALLVPAFWWHHVFNSSDEEDYSLSLSWGYSADTLTKQLFHSFSERVVDRHF